LALLSALGTDFGLMKDFPGFSLTGYFHIHTVSPSWEYFNFADCDEPGVNQWYQIFLAHQFSRPVRMFFFVFF